MHVETVVTHRVNNGLGFPSTGSRMKNRSASKALTPKGRGGNNSLAVSLCSPDGYCASVESNSKTVVVVGGLALLAAVTVYAMKR